jgi:GntR family transcriptional repressor for pyruvate dehydrogenase complex
VAEHGEPSALPDAVLRPVRDRNAFESTVEVLAGAVKLGVFADGERLPPERDLAERLRVSRQTLREAIAALRDAGFVETYRGRHGGTVVTYRGPRPDRADAERLARRDGPGLADALDFRRVVEPGAAYLAASRSLTAEQRAWVASSLEAVERAGDPASYRIADSRLHLAIAALTGSEMLIAAVTEAQTAVAGLLAAIPVLPRNIAHSNEQHAQVVEAVLGGRPDEARRAMEEHCDGTSALLRGLLG